MRNKTYFFSTINPLFAQSLHILIGASKLHSEHQNEKKLDLLLKEDIIKRHSWRVLFYLFKLIITGRIFFRKIVFAKYRGYSVGRHAVSHSYRDIRSYANKLFHYSALLMSLKRGCELIESVLPYCEEIDSSYIEHGAYINGILYEIFSEYGIAIYANVYPYSLTRWEFLHKQAFEYTVQIHRQKITENKVKQGEKALRNVIEHTELMPYINISFRKPTLSHYDFSHIIYCHSFTDAQMNFGYDGAFLNVLEWLEFTIQHLRGKKICIKAHPNLYATGYQSNVLELDRRIFEKIIWKYGDDPDITIIDFPMRNKELLDQANPQTILISHHGNAILEGAFLGYKCISSKATVWQSFDLFNIWGSEEEYVQFLNAKPDELKMSDQELLYGFYYLLFCDPSGYFSTSTWQEKISKKIGISRKEFIKRPLLDRWDESDINSLIVEIKESITIRR
jgi:hypothetical protein